MKVHFSSSCLHLALCTEAVHLLAFQSHMLCFGYEDQVPRDMGNSRCSRTEHLVKICSIKTTVTFLRLLLASSWSRAKNKFLMCSIFLFTTWKAAHSAVYRFSFGSTDLSRSQPLSLVTNYLMLSFLFFSYFLTLGLCKVFFRAAEMLPAHLLTAVHQTWEYNYTSDRLLIHGALVKSCQGQREMGPAFSKNDF